MSDKREKLLRDLLQKIALERAYSDPVVKTAAVPVTSANFSSQLFHATISAAGKPDLTLFGKVAVLGEVFRAHGVPAKLYDIERYVYTKLLNIYHQIEEKHKVPEEHRLVTPKFYGYNDTYLEEVMVLQDLSREGFTTYDQLKPIDWDSASATVVELAKLHSLSIAFQTEYPGEYKQALEVLVWNIEDSESVRAVHKQMNDNMLAMMSEKNRPRLKRFLNEKFNEQTMGNLYKPLRRPVIIHSDIKPSNLMHRMDENGKLQVLIVDYQTLHPGSAVTDLVTFLTSGSDGPFRRQHFDQLVEHYYENMAAALRRLGLDPEDVYPRADFDYELKELLPMMLVYGSLALPIIMGDHSDLPAGEADSFQTLVNVDKTNCFVAQRLNEIVEDFVRWGLM